MNPAAVLRVLVEAEGIAKLQRQVKDLDRDLEKAGHTSKGTKGNMAAMGAGAAAAGKGVDDAGKKAGKSTGKLAAMGAVAGKAAKFGLAGVAAGAPLAAAKLISLASDAEETAAKFRTVFGKETDNAIKKLDAFSKATGTSKFALREQAAQFQALIRPMGLATEDAGKMSIGMTKLATDLASFNNSSVEEAILALNSGLVGEAEPLRRFGVQLSAARIEAFAYAEGIAKQGAELTAAQKAQASYGIILKDTKLAQGDAVRTSDSFANQWKRLKAQVTDLATELGIKFLPIAAKVIGWLTSAIGAFSGGGKAADGFGAKFASVFQAIGSWIDRHQDDLNAVVAAVENVGKAIVWVWENWTLPVIERVLPAIVGIVEGAFEVIGGVVDVLSGILTGDFGRAWEGVKRIFGGGVKVVLNLIRGITAPLREILSRIGDAMSAAWRGIRETANSAWQRVKELIVNPVRTAFETVRDAVRSVHSWLRDAFVNVRDTVGGVWQRIKELIQNPMEAARDFVTRIANNLWGNVREGFLNVRDKIGDWASGLKDKIVDAFKGAANKVVDFVNAIIGVVNKIPGVNIGRVKGFASGGEMHVAADKMQALARGGKINRPMAIVGEEAPRHPEYVIPTNPAYRKRSLGLLNEVADKLGIHGFAKGGSLAGSTGGVLDTIKNVGSGALDLVLKGPGALLDLLPNPADMLPNWLRGLGNVAIEGVTKWIKDKVNGLFGGGGGAMGNGAPGWGIMDALARKFGLAITSTFRNTSTFHGQMGSDGRARATDYSNATHPTMQMMSFAQAAKSLFGKNLAELFYSPMGGSIKHGSWIDGMIVGGPLGTPGNHYNHVHVAMALGGLLHKMGFEGGSSLPFVGKFHDGGIAAQEGLAHVRAGEPIGLPEVRVFIGERELTDIVRVEVRDSDRQKAGTYRAGVVPA